MIITYDEGGGFWDHVAPPRPDAYGYGTRMPALLISPFGRRGCVDHKVGDTTSALAFIASRFGPHSSSIWRGPFLLVRDGSPTEVITR